MVQYNYQCIFLFILIHIHVAFGSFIFPTSSIIAKSDLSSDVSNSISSSTHARGEGGGIVTSDVMEGLIGASSTIDSKGEHPHKRKVLILYTGGTMGMQHIDRSYSPVPGYLTKCIQELPEMHHPEMPSFTIKEYSPLLDSSNMGPSDWAKIAEDIKNNYLDYDGFVVIMGTDTMAYASSAMSFMLENLGKSVIFTGSQIPFCEVYNDARRNLIVSMIFAARSDIPEVCLCFNDKLLRANRAVKVSSSELNAFDSPNFSPLATLGAHINENKDIILPQPRGPFKVHTKLDSKILVLKLVPGFDDESIQALVESKSAVKGIVLELYGTGNGPSNDKGSLMKAIRTAKEKGIVCVAVSQCLSGGVSLDTYSLGKEFQMSGVVSGGDMTTEACSTKLAYLFGRIKNPDVVAKAMSTNIRGEMTPAGEGGVHAYFDRIGSKL